MERQLRMKKVITVIAVCLLIAVYIMIFLFSADDAEAIVRKMAHFTEYMAVGFLSFGIAVIWMQRIKAGIVAVTLQVFLSAGLDEIHQYFVPGRYASFRDVLIDTAGGIAGIMIVFLMYKIRKRRR